MRESLHKFVSSHKDGVYYVGHACALVRINQELFLFDPIWNHKPYGEYWEFYPSQVDCDEILSQIKGVIISHIHEDHVCLPILKRLPKDCKIHVMKGRRTLIDRLLNSFHCIEDYDKFTWEEIRPGVDIMFVPHAFNSIDSSCFIRSNKYCVYVGSDNFLDEKLLDQLGDIEVNVAMIPYAFIHWYPRCMNMTPDEMTPEIKRLNQQSMDQACRTIEVLDPQAVIPFGNNLFYCDQNSILNKKICEPFDLVDHAITTGEYILSDGVRSVNTDKETFPHRQLPPINLNVDIEPWMLEEIRDRLKKVTARVPNHEIIVNGIGIDLETLEVSIRMNPGEKPFTRFDFDAEQFKDWAIGFITFEQAIGTRRFMCTRIPDVYNLSVFEFMNNYL